MSTSNNTTTSNLTGNFGLSGLNPVDGWACTEQQAWTLHINESLQGVSDSLRSLDGSEDAHTRAGWAMVEQALRLGASALQSMHV